MSQGLERYYNTLQELKILEGTSALLSWDQEAIMPEKATEFRSKQRSYIAAKHHEVLTNKSFVNLVNQLNNEAENLDSVDARSVQVTKRHQDKQVKLPSEFVMEMSKSSSISHQKWLEAKKKEDFSIFEPHLTKQFEFSKKYASHIDDSKPIYDVLLDDYEEGMKSDEVDEIFTNLKLELKDLLGKVQEKKGFKKTSEFEKINFDEGKIKEFTKNLTEKIGFDYDRGQLGVVHHPFESTLSPNDVRINISTHHKDLQSVITGAIHELGHGLYEQNIHEKYNKTDLSVGVSLGVHESQSRLLENMIGRSRSFAKFLASELNSFFNASLDFENIYNDLNIVKPSLIRIEADEITYNMHIILRYEVEKKILNGDLKVSELPEYWNSQMEDLLGVKPDKLSKGCLQDTHWAMGAIGYFPTYSLGNIIAGQLWANFLSQTPNFENEIESGNFTSYFNFFKDNIWQYGSFYKPSELLEMTGIEDYSVRGLVSYLERKFLVN